MAASPRSWDFLLLRLRELRLPLSRETRRIASNDLERRRELCRIIRHLGSGIQRNGDKRSGNGMIQPMKTFISLLVICLLCGITAAPASDEASLNQAISSLN